MGASSNDPRSATASPRRLLLRGGRRTFPRNAVRGLGWHAAWRFERGGLLGLGYDDLPAGLLPEGVAAGTDEALVIVRAEHSCLLPLNPSAVVVQSPMTVLRDRPPCRPNNANHAEVNMQAVDRRLAAIPFVLALVILAVAHPCEGG